MDSIRKAEQALTRLIDAAACFSKTVRLKPRHGRGRAAKSSSRISEQPRTVERAAGPGGKQ